MTITLVPRARKASPAPPAPPARSNDTGATGLGPIVPQSKRQHHFDDLAVTLAAKYGWVGGSTDLLDGIQVVDAQNFVRKTLHEIHVAAAGGDACPELSHVGEHLGLEAEYAAELLATLKSVYEAEVAELKSHDPAKLKAIFEQNAAEDVETRKRIRIAQALDGAEG